VLCKLLVCSKKNNSKHSIEGCSTCTSVQMPLNSPMRQTKCTQMLQWISVTVYKWMAMIHNHWVRGQITKKTIKNKLNYSTAGKTIVYAEYINAFICCSSTKSSLCKLTQMLISNCCHIKQICHFHAAFFSTTDKKQNNYGQQAKNSDLAKTISNAWKQQTVTMPQLLGCFR